MYVFKCEYAIVNSGVLAILNALNAALHLLTYTLNYDYIYAP